LHENITHHCNHNSLNALPFLTLEMGYLTLQIIAIFGSNFSAYMVRPNLQELIIMYMKDKLQSYIRPLSEVFAFGP
tara:strand:+ start:980 stop:1207 length:228 start_codon:yes stop_codon:yes gene_type:complete